MSFLIFTRNDSLHKYFQRIYNLWNITKLTDKALRRDFER